MSAQVMALPADNAMALHTGHEPAAALGDTSPG
jgi:hypothetical protein